MQIEYDRLIDQMKHAYPGFVAVFRVGFHENLAIHMPASLPGQIIAGVCLEIERLHGLGKRDLLWAEPVLSEVHALLGEVFDRSQFTPDVSPLSFAAKKAITGDIESVEGVLCAAEGSDPSMVLAIHATAHLTAAFTSGIFPQGIEYGDPLDYYDADLRTYQQIGGETVPEGFDEAADHMQWGIHLLAYALALRYNPETQHWRSMERVF